MLLQDAVYWGSGGGVSFGLVVSGFVLYIQKLKKKNCPPPPKKHPPNTRTQTNGRTHPAITAAAAACCSSIDCEAVPVSVRAVQAAATCSVAASMAGSTGANCCSCCWSSAAWWAGLAPCICLAWWREGLGVWFCSARRWSAVVCCVWGCHI